MIDLDLKLDPAAITAAALQFARDGHVRLENAFAPETAEALHRHLADELEWWRVVNQGEQTWDLGPESIAALERDGDAQLMELVHKGARDGFQFLFDSVRVSDEANERASRGLLVDSLIDAMCSPHNLGLLREVVGDATVVKVDGQATRYLPGHFLTGHDDAIDGKGRSAAYVINLTPEWRTEWGGLLQFHDANGDVTKGLKPCFNAIHLFKVPQVHSVSLVTPFAGAPRLSVTGWLRRW
jgi:Rps23 Pro-64 3,4-dihydroxylase Tpa1-like proline 4-hydroxylase